MEESKFVCKYCSKRFPSGKSLGGHIRTHTSEERRNNVDCHMLKLDGGRKRNKKDSWSEDVGGNSIYGLRENPKKTIRFVHSQCDTAPTHPRKSKRTRSKTLTLANHPSSSSSVVPLANGSGSSPVSEVEQEQEEVARCLMMLSKDSSHRGRFATVTESSDNNSIVLEAKSSFLDTRAAMSNAYELVEKKLVKDTKLKSAEIGACDNSDSRYGPKTKMLDSDVTSDKFKGVKVEDKSRTEDYVVESRKILSRGRSKSVMEDLDCDGTDGTRRKFDSRKRANSDTLSHNLGGHKRSHFIGGSEENTMVIEQGAPAVPCLVDLNLPAVPCQIDLNLPAVPCLIDLNLPAPVDE